MFGDLTENKTFYFSKRTLRAGTTSNKWLKKALTVFFSMLANEFLRKSFLGPVVQHVQQIFGQSQLNPALPEKIFAFLLNAKHNVKIQLHQKGNHICFASKARQIIGDNQLPDSQYDINNLLKNNLHWTFSYTF